MYISHWLLHLFHVLSTCLIFAEMQLGSLILYVMHQLHDMHVSVL